jgi:hypothetical protein
VQRPGGLSSSTQLPLRPPPPTLLFLYSHNLYDIWVHEYQARKSHGSGTTESSWLLASCSKFCLSAGNHDGARVRGHGNLIHLVLLSTRCTCPNLIPNTMTPGQRLVFRIMLKSGLSPPRLPLLFTFRFSLAPLSSRNAIVTTPGTLSCLRFGLHNCVHHTPQRLRTALRGTSLLFLPLFVVFTCNCQ